jgi:oligosaccharide repeat unit polymerase
MYKYLLFFSGIVPLIGVFQMERGAYGVSIGMVGFQNGATEIYAVYVMVLFLTFFIFTTSRKLPEIRGRHELEQRYRPFALATGVFILLMLAMMLFGFGAYHVWLGEIGKGSFRANLGPFGAIAYLSMKAVIPTLVAFQSILYLSSGKTRKDKIILFAIFMATFIVGSTWGSKTTGLTMLLPAMIIIYWNASAIKIFKIVLCFIAVIILAFQMFDANVEAQVNVINFLWTRTTTIQGDVSWYIWDQFSSGVQFPSYSKTLLPFMGDTLFSLITDISRPDYELWADYHFDTLIGYLVGLPLDIVEEGHSIVGTPFSEGLILGGVPGVVLMAFLGGAISGWLYRKIHVSILHNRPYVASIYATYLGIHVLSWLFGGAIVQLVHVSVFIGILVSYVICLLFSFLSSKHWRLSNTCGFQLRESSGG